MTSSDDLEERNRMVYVSGLHENVTKELLYELFVQVGPLENIVVKEKAGTGQNAPSGDSGNTDSPSSARKGNFAFSLITFKDSESVPFAVKMLNDIELFRTPLVVKPRDGSSHAQEQRDVDRQQNQLQGVQQLSMMMMRQQHSGVGAMSPDSPAFSHSFPGVSGVGNRGMPPIPFHGGGTPFASPSMPSGGMVLNVTSHRSGGRDVNAYGEFDQHQYGHHQQQQQQQQRHTPVTSSRSIPGGGHRGGTRFEQQQQGSWRQGERMDNFRGRDYEQRGGRSEERRHHQQQYDNNSYGGDRSRSVRDYGGRPDRQNTHIRW